MYVKLYYSVDSDVHIVRMSEVLLVNITILQNIVRYILADSATIILYVALRKFMLARTVY